MMWRAKILNDGYWWSDIEVRGVWQPFYRVGRAGACVRF